MPLVESSVPTVTKEGQDGNTGEVTYKVTTPTGDKYPNGSKVTINGKEYTVDDEGKVKVPNSDLPATTIPASPTKAQETGKLPKDGNTVEVPAKLVESSVPTVTKEGQDGNTGEVTYKVTTPTGDKYPNGSKVTINGKEYTVDDEGKVKVPNSDLPATTIPASPTKAQETGKLPKDGNTVEVPARLTSSNGEPEVQTETPEYTGPISSNGVDGNGNLIDPPTVELPEFNGGVNGELPDPVELPKVKLIITKWIDEQGNELKPADAKAPAVLGEANEALEAGEIAGYVFVRTDVNEEGDVVTHVFRKVTPTKPEGNGEQQGGDNTPQPTPEVPTDNTERKPETEKPTVPDTKQAEQPTQTVDAQVAPSQNQAVLPNTGTKADRATGALGALSLLGAFGLLFAKKKKDDEEETRNN